MKAHLIVPVAALIVARAPTLAFANDDDDGLRALSPEARKEYDENFVWVDDLLTVGRHDGVRRGFLIYQGKYRQPLSSVDFYEKLGRPDYVDFIRTRQHTRAGLAVGGGVLIAASIAIAFSRFEAASHCDVPVSDPRFGDACVNRPGPDLTLPLLLNVAGLGALMTAVFINPDPLSPPDMRRLADQYNDKLLHRLAGPPAASKPPSLQLDATPYATIDGGGLVLSGAF